MLQQTRVSTVLPYYTSFLAKFPDIGALADASETELLQAWSGLGYYSRARNMQRAARDAAGRFPCTFHQIRALPGVGEYTAAAIASIAFGLPHASVDGNVLRVTARLANDCGDISAVTVRCRLTAFAQELLDPQRPGDFNQAMMELGATLCLPGQPKCLTCPVSGMCRSRAAGTQAELPVKAAPSALVRVHRRMLVVLRGEAVLLWQRPSDASRLAGFWELPEPEHFDVPPPARSVGRFRHSITNHAYSVEVLVSADDQHHTRPACKKTVKSAWIETHQLGQVVLSTTARKALQLCRRAGSTKNETSKTDSLREVCSRYFSCAGSDTGTSGRSASSRDRCAR
jgi:A/G-specific adenine glycosylase